MHKNKLNGKVYIGKSNNIKLRWRSNGVGYKPDKNKNQNRPFWNAIQKYGWNNFEHIVLIDNLTDIEANELEKEYIQKYNSREKEFGYNVAEGGDGGRIYINHPKGFKGKHHNEITRQIQSETMKKVNELGLNTNWKNGHPKGFKGKHHSEENKKTMTINAVECIKRKVIAILPNGECREFDSVSQLRKELSISNTIVYKLLKTNEPFNLSPNTYNNREYLKTLVGLKLLYKDNTEVIN